MLSALAAFPQSGRRPSVPPAVSAPTPEASPSDNKPVAKEQPREPLIIGAAPGETMAGIPFYYSDSVLQSCVARLEDSHTVKVEVVSREMTRSDAVKRARSEKATPVAWLELRSDNSFSQSSSNNLDSIYIVYTIFEPTTAKVIAHGNSYQGAYRKGGVTLPPTSGRANTSITESRLRDAAQDAADRILKALNIASPSDFPIHYLRPLRGTLRRLR